MKEVFLLSFLLQFCARAGEEGEAGTCEAATGSVCGSGAGLFQEDELKWQFYLKRISEALDTYQECSEDVGVPGGCGCLDSVWEADLSVWRKRGGITEADFIAGKSRSARAVHYQIINHTLYRQESCMFPARCEGVEHFLLRIVDELPDMDLLVNVMDYPLSGKHGDPLPIFSFSKTPSYYDLLYPAWSFWCGGPAIATDPRGIGRWDLRRETLKEASERWAWQSKKNVAFFRGSRTSSERDPLIRLSLDHPELVEAKYTKNQAWKSLEDTLGVEPAEVVTMEHHCQYKYLFNFRGVAASFRLRHLFLCGSLVLHVGTEWVEFFYPSLRPWVHYIPVDTSLQSVEEILEFLRSHDDVAREIAARGYHHIWNHLDMEDVTCYWKALLLGYARLASWTVLRQESFIAVKATNRW